MFVLTAHSNASWVPVSLVGGGVWRPGLFTGVAWAALTLAPSTLAQPPSRSHRLAFCQALARPEKGPCSCGQELPT